MGRRKIEIQPLSDDRNRTVTFVKRKAGLFKKAHELAVLCQVDLSVIIVGNNNRIYEYSTVDTKEVLNCYEKTLNTRKHVHEAKSPENYLIYRKKRHLHEPLTDKKGRVVGTTAHLHDDDVDQDMFGEDEYEDDDDERDDTSEGEILTRTRKRPRNRQSTATTNKSRNPKVFNSKSSPPPPPPSQISLNNVPPFNKYKKPSITVSSHLQSLPPLQLQQNTPSPNMGRKENSSRPVLRVQIPTDAKGNQTKSGTFNLDIKETGSTDTARTITAVENTSSSMNQSSNNHTGVSGSTSGSHHGIGNAQHSMHLGDGDVLHNTANSKYGATNHLMRTQTPSAKFSGYSSFRSPDSRKPTLPLPINSKSQTSSPASATYPGLPNPLTQSSGGGVNSRSSSGGSNVNAPHIGDNIQAGERQNNNLGNSNNNNNEVMSADNNNLFSPSGVNLNSGSFYSMNQGPSSSSYMNYSMQGFNQQYQQYNQNASNQQSLQLPHPQTYQQQLHPLLQLLALPQSAVITSELLGQLPSAQPQDSATKSRPQISFFGQHGQQNLQMQQQQQQQQQQLLQLQMQQSFGNSGGGGVGGGGSASGGVNGEQTPISALPSRYVNDIFPFPSPSNFLAPQDWSTGMTPTPSQAPQFFMSMMPLNSGGGGNSGGGYHSQVQQQSHALQQDKGFYSDDRSRPNAGIGTEQAQPARTATTGVVSSREATFGAIAEEDENGRGSGNHSSVAPTNVDDGSKVTSHVTTEATSTGAPSDV